MKRFYKINSIFFFLSISFIFNSGLLAQRKVTATLSITPQPAYMGAIPIGSYADREIIIYNASIQTVNISSVSITGGDASVFSIVDNPGNTSLGALEQLILNVRFQPNNTNDVLAMLQINSDAGTFSDSLIGNGTSDAHGIITFERIFGTQFDDGASSFVQTADKGYILVGSTTKQNQNYTDVYVIRTDKYGKVLWSNTYGGNYDDGASDVVQTPDSNFVIVGTSSSFGAGQAQVYLLKIDEDGNKIWEKTFGENKDVAASNIRNTTDGDFIITGNTKDTPDNSRDALLLKVDKNGILLWKKHYGTSDGESAVGITLTSDGGYIFTGSDANGSSGDFNVYCVKTDADGNALWTKTYGGPNWEGGSTIITTQDGGYMISGYTVSYGAGAEDGFLVKIDKDGNEQWHNAYGYVHNDRFSSVVQMPDGGYLASGSTVNYFTVNYTYTDAYFVRTDADGNLVWSKTYGSDKNDNVGRILKADDGAYVTLGNTNSYGQSQDFYFLKINENGMITGVSENKKPQLPGSFSLRQNYPNPFNPSTKINFSILAKNSGESHVVLKIYNLLGQEVSTLMNKELPSGNYSVTFNTEKLGGVQLSSGIYFYRLTADNYSETKKMVLMK